MASFVPYRCREAAVFLAAFVAGVGTGIVDAEGAALDEGDEVPPVSVPFFGQFISLHQI